MGSQRQEGRRRQGRQAGTRGCQRQGRQRRQGSHADGLRREEVVMGLRLISPPAQLFTLDEAKVHLRVVDTDEDDLINALVRAATTHAENWTGRAFVDQTWDYYVDSFPTGSNLEIRIPKPPLIEVESVIYNDTAGVEETMDPLDSYVANVSAPGGIVAAG